MESTTIHLERKPAWGDIFSSYKIFLDADPVGSIRQGKSCSFEVRPGRHEIFLTIDWCSSQHLTIDLAPGEEVKLICQGRNVVFGVYYLTFCANDYIKLSQEPFKNLTYM